MYDDQHTNESTMDKQVERGDYIQQHMVGTTEDQEVDTTNSEEDDQEYVPRVYHTAREFYATRSRKFLGACLDIGAQKTCIGKA